MNLILLMQRNMCCDAVTGVESVRFVKVFTVLLRIVLTPLRLARVQGEPPSWEGIDMNRVA